VNAAWDLASHDIAIAGYWLGSPPLRVSATGGCWINAGIEDAVFATLVYPGDVRVQLHASWLNARKARDITLIGERRMITLDDMNLIEPLRIYDKQVTEARTRMPLVDSFASFRASVREGEILIPKIAPAEPLKIECEHFLDCVADGREPLTSAEHGLGIVRVLDAIDRSLRDSGREVEIV
jgi:predicted dehydrogenase